MTAPEPPHIAIVGAGAKAVAIACHVAALVLVKAPVQPRVTIIEKEKEVGSLWSTAGGYSDGEGEMYTAALRDLGFPYHRYRSVNTDEMVFDQPRDAVDFQRAFDLECSQRAQRHKAMEKSGRGIPAYDSALYADVERILRTEFSIPAWLSRKEDPYGYKNFFKRWIDAGSPKLRHHEFKNYLEDSLQHAIGLVDKSSPKAISVEYNAKETKLKSLGHEKWEVRFEVNGESRILWVDGVVITGVGQPREASGIECKGPNDLADGRRLDTKTFWETGWEARLQTVISQVQQEVQSIKGATDPKPRVLIAGGGGAGVAVVERLRYFSTKVHIVVVGRGPTLAPRIATRFHDDVYGENETWHRLQPEERSEVVKSDKGKPWAISQSRVECTGGVEFIPGYVASYQAEPETARYGIDRWIANIYVGKTKKQKDQGVLRSIDRRECTFDILIDARGFNYEKHVSKLLEDEKIKTLLGRLGEEDSVMLPWLAFPQAGIRRLHLPNHDCAADINPAAANLMALGWLATAILEPYVYGLE